MSTSPGGAAAAVFAVYWRAAEHGHWTWDCNLLDRALAYARASKMVNTSRGRWRVAETRVLEYSAERDVQQMVRLGKEEEAVRPTPPPGVRSNWAPGREPGALKPKAGGTGKGAKAQAAASVED